MRSCLHLCFLSDSRMKDILIKKWYLFHLWVVIWINKWDILVMFDQHGLVGWHFWPLINPIDPLRHWFWKYRGVAINTNDIPVPIPIDPSADLSWINQTMPSWHFHELSQKHWGTSSIMQIVIQSWEQTDVEGALCYLKVFWSGVRACMCKHGLRTSGIRIISEDLVHSDALNDWLSWLQRLFINVELLYMWP